MAINPFGSGFPTGSFAGSSIAGFKTGVQAGSTTAVRLPSVACSYVNLVAPKSNTGEVYIGPDTSVTVEAGTSNFTTGWELQAGQQTGWLPVTNLDMFSIICDAATDDLIFMCV